MLSCYRASLVQAAAFPGGQHRLRVEPEDWEMWKEGSRGLQPVAFPLPHTELRREERKDTPGCSHLRSIATPHFQGRLPDTPPVGRSCLVTQVLFPSHLLYPWGAVS